MLPPLSPLPLQVVVCRTRCSLAARTPAFPRRSCSPHSARTLSSLRRTCRCSSAARTPSFLCRSCSPRSARTSRRSTGSRVSSRTPVFPHSSCCSLLARTSRSQPRRSSCSTSSARTAEFLDSTRSQAAAHTSAGTCCSLWSAHTPEFPRSCCSSQRLARTCLLGSSCCRRLACRRQSPHSRCSVGRVSSGPGGRESCRRSRSMDPADTAPCLDRSCSRELARISACPASTGSSLQWARTEECPHTCCSRLSAHTPSSPPCRRSRSRGREHTSGTLCRSCSSPPAHRSRLRDTGCSTRAAHTAECRCSTCSALPADMLVPPLCRSCRSTVSARTSSFLGSSCSPRMARSCRSAHCTGCCQRSARTSECRHSCCSLR